VRVWACLRWNRVADNARLTHIVEGLIAEVAPAATFMVCPPPEAARAIATSPAPGLAVIDWINPIAATLDIVSMVHQALPLAWITVVGGVEQRRHIRVLLEAGANELVRPDALQTHLRAILRGLLATIRASSAAAPEEHADGYTGDPQDPR
jgi:hypothetical protein